MDGTCVATCSRSRLPRSRAPLYHAFGWGSGIVRLLLDDLPMTDAVHLIGLDFGTTTCSAVIAAARLLRNSVTGRVELSNLNECYRSAIAFTPIQDERLDLARLEQLLDQWLLHVEAGTLFGGGALLTGLTAERANAPALVSLIRRRIGDAVVACADDPRLEAWLAFMGCCASLSRQHPRTAFINLDIGGGTTNLALGVNGEVLATSCLFIGARHVEVMPGSYRIVKLSVYARRLFEHLGIHKSIGASLDADDIRRLLDQYVAWLDAAVRGSAAAFADPVAKLHIQAPFQPVVPPEVDRVVITLSGGVGELVYAALAGQPPPGQTAFGDLGIDLANRLLQTPWAADLREFAPPAGGRATAFGLLRHSTQVSGSTLFLSDPALLPVRDLPILGSIAADLPQPQWQALLDLIQASAPGSCVQIDLADASADKVRGLGTRIRQALQKRRIAPDRLLVLLVSGNVGKTLGHYITQWGLAPRSLVVIDEVGLTDARFVHIGRLHDNVVPVSYYGLQP